MNLLIIGNGFDLARSLPTRYSSVERNQVRHNVYVYNKLLNACRASKLSRGVSVCILKG